MAKVFQCRTSQIPEAVEYVRQYLTEKDFERKAIAGILLRLEDTINALVQKAPDPNEHFSIRITNGLGFLGKARIVLKCRGEVVTIDDVVPQFEFEGLAPEAVEILNRRMKPLTSRVIHLRYRFGVNTASIDAGRRKVSRLTLNLLTMFSGILIGIILRLLLPQATASFIATEVFGMVTTIFFNLLKMIVAPLVFFSIITSVSGFSDIGELGSVGIKTIALFVFFSIASLLIGYGIFTLMPSGDPAIQAMIDSPQTVAVVQNTSSMAWQNIKSFLLGIFPANLLGVFVENNVLGVIFLALLTGITVNKLQSDKADTINRAIDAGNELITRLTAAITSKMPILVFFSLGKLAMTVKIDLLGTLAKYLGAVAIGFVLMVAFYMLSMLVCGINPLEFLKGFGPAIFTGFTLASSTATVPASLDCCVNRLKIPRAITYFVIPLGSTINMSGSCIMLLISCLFLAKVFCIEVSFTMMIPVMLMLLLLSMAAPGVPGSMVIMLASVLPVIGVPAEAANVTVWFSSLVGMMMVPVNSMGDAVTAMIVSHTQAGKKMASREQTL